MLEKLIEKVENQYIGGQTKQVAVPEESLFQIMTYNEYKSMGSNDLATILERQNIVIRDMPTKDMRFDAVGLATLCLLHAIIEMQGSCNVIDSIQLKCI